MVRLSKGARATKFEMSVSLIARIVSGLDGDGAEALRGIKDAGGVTIAQKPDTAAEPDMPNSAVDSGWVDFVLTPEEIAGKIMAIASAETSSEGSWPPMRRCTPNSDTMGGVWGPRANEAAW